MRGVERAGKTGLSPGRVSRGPGASFRAARFIEDRMNPETTDPLETRDVARHEVEIMVDG